jgi:hypothetical protein
MRSRYTNIAYSRQASRAPWFRRLSRDLKRIGVRLRPAGRVTPHSIVVVKDREDSRPVLAAGGTALLIAGTEGALLQGADTILFQIEHPRAVIDALHRLPSEHRLLRQWTPEAWGETVKGKHVAVVGSADSFNGKGLGELVDGADLVVRMSHCAVSRDRAPVDWGRRTDVVVFNTSAYWNFLKAPVWRDPLGSDPEIFYLTNFGRYRPDGFDPIDDPRNPGRRLDVNPTLGTLLTHYALQGGAAKVSCYAMDFFRSTDPFAPRRGEICRIRYNGKGRSCHCHKLDEALLKTYLDDPRFQPDDVLRYVLNNPID